MTKKIPPYELIQAVPFVSPKPGVTGSWDTICCSCNVSERIRRVMFALRIRRSHITAWSHLGVVCVHCVARIGVELLEKASL